MAPDLERLARMPWPMACWASTAANSAHAFEELMSTMRTASIERRQLGPLAKATTQKGLGCGLGAAPEDITMSERSVQISTRKLS